MPRSIYEEARDVDREWLKTEAFERSRRDRKRVEMLFAHLKRILRLGRLRLRGPRGAQFEFTLAGAHKLDLLIAGSDRIFGNHSGSTTHLCGENGTWKIRDPIYCDNPKYAIPYVQRTALVPAPTMSAAFERFSTPQHNSMTFRVFSAVRMPFANGKLALEISIAHWPLEAAYRVFDMFFQNSAVVKLDRYGDLLRFDGGIDFRNNLAAEINDDRIAHRPVAELFLATSAFN